MNILEGVSQHVNMQNTEVAGQIIQSHPSHPSLYQRTEREGGGGGYGRGIGILC